MAGVVRDLHAPGRVAGLRRRQAQVRDGIARHDRGDDVGRALDDVGGGRDFVFGRRILDDGKFAGRRQRALGGLDVGAFDVAAAAGEQRERETAASGQKSP